MDFIKRNRYWLGLAALLLPILVRGIWFYQGWPAHRDIRPPDYATNAVPLPPVSTPASATVQAFSGRIVVFDAAHSNQFTSSELEYFTNELGKRGGRVEIDSGETLLATRLKYASAYVVIAPNAAFSAEEIQLIQDFVSRGGRLLVFTDPTRPMTNIDMYSGTVIVRPDSEFANPLLAAIKMTVSRDYLYNLVSHEGNFRNVFFTRFGKDPLTRSLNQVALYGSHSIITQGGTPLLIGDPNTLSSATDTGGDLVAAALSADRNVLAIGDMSFLISPYNTVADNGQFISLLADFALSASRSYSIADFPYVFERPVSILTTGVMEMESDLLTPIANLQNTLRTTNITLEFGTKSTSGTDLLVLGSLESSQDLDPYIQPFQLNLEDPKTITLPAFGMVNRAGLGLLLYDRTPKKNMLVLLTDQLEDMSALVELLSSGDLSPCILQKNTALCTLSSGSGSSSDYFPSNEDFSLEGFSLTPDIFSPTEVTPTPGW